MTGDATLLLLRRAAGGDREAYSGLVEKYAERIRRVSYLLLHSSAAAEDVAQETFTVALTQLGSYREEGDPSSWFLSIALNLCRKILRDEKRHAATAEPKALETGKRIRFAPRGILTSLVRRETARTVAVALGYLTEPQKEAFVLHYIEELPYEEVAALMGTNPGAARALGHRARQVLKGRLKSLEVGTTKLIT